MPESAFKTRVTLATQPPHVIPCIVIVTCSIIFPSFGSGVGAPTSQQQRIGDDRNGARGHGRPCDDWAQHAECSERYAQDIVGERKKQVLPYLSQCRPG